MNRIESNQITRSRSPPTTTATAKKSVFVAKYTPLYASKDMIAVPMPMPKPIQNADFYSIPNEHTKQNLCCAREVRK